MCDDQVLGWPELAVVTADLRRIGRSDVADQLVHAVLAGATGTEVLGAIGLVLRHHRALRSRLSGPAARAWGSVMTEVFKAFPGSRLRYWVARFRRH